MLYLACGAAQVEAAGTTAQLHRVRTSDQALFGWLEQNSEVGAVVATTDLRLSTVLPVYTHDGTLLANGSRTSASDDELIERIPPGQRADEDATRDGGTTANAAERNA